MMGIYKITNIVNGKVYIGQSVNITHRWACHKYDLIHDRHKNPHFQNAYNKNPEAFKLEIECLCKEEDLDRLEVYYIKKYKSNNPEFGYNLDSGGYGAGRMSDETKARLSRAKMGNQAMKGIKLSEEWKKHLAEAQPHKKKVICIETNEVFESFADAARKTGLNRTKIVSCCTGKRNKTGGLHFKYDTGTSD